MPDDLPDTETYIGDGVYASFDGYNVRLRAPRENGDHFVALEPDVYKALQRWIALYPRLKTHMEG